jgi:serine/threonine protein kinase
MLQRPGAIIAGKYRLESPLARGGVGTVWVAHHVQLGHPVAVKFLSANVAASPQVRTRFEREARAAAHLRTPHIVQVFDYGIQADTPYLVMELLKGETLGAYLRRVKRMPLADAYRLIAQVGKGLRRVHEVGFVHRDLKPANLYLARSGDDDEDIVKILDFGIAKETGGELVGESTKTGELVGSPHYMSPEQIRGEREVDSRTDLWALGVILYKMVTGYLPFPGEVLTAVITKIVVDPIPSARDYLPGAPPLLDAFFAKALARDRSLRFQNARELVLAFGQVAALDAGMAAPQVLAPADGSPHSSRASFPDLSTFSGFPGSLSGSFPGGPSSGAFPSGFPSSMPGMSMSGSFPGVPGVPSSGAFPGGAPSSNAFPGGVPGSMPGIPSSGGFPGVPDRGSIPGFVPGGSIPGAGPDSVSRESADGGMRASEGGGPAGAFSPEGPRASMPSFPTMPSPPFPAGPASSPATLTSSTASVPGPAPSRPSRWIFAAIGGALMLVAGVTVFALRSRGPAAAEGGTPLEVVLPAATQTLAPAHSAAPSATAEPTAAASVTAEPAPSATAEAAPALAATAEPTASAAPAPAASESAASEAKATPVASGKPHAVAPGAKARPSGPKKPVDTIE